MLSLNHAPTQERFNQLSIFYTQLPLFPGMECYSYGNEGDGYAYSPCQCGRCPDCTDDDAPLSDYACVVCEDDGCDECRVPADVAAWMAEGREVGQLELVQDGFPKKVRIA